VAKRNKKTIEQLIARKRECLLRARRNLAEAIEIDETIEKMRAGKIKSPTPAGVKVKLSTSDRVTADEFGDLVPTFSSTGIGGFE
jgi:hypothetical protein